MSFKNSQTSNASLVTKILVVAANPQGTSPLRLDKEVREMMEALQLSHKRDEFQIIPRWAVREKDLRRAMLEVDPQVVHFCGHGAGHQGLVLESETGQASLIEAEKLAEFFGLFQDRVECVVLNACYSEVQAQEIVKHINYVVGMRQAINDEEAIKFSIAFYDAFLARKDIEFAYKIACNHISSSFKKEAIPVFKKKQA